jgi:predicted RNA binding protein YcfA (HicA-like mRNA interferase family)
MGKLGPITPQKFERFLKYAGCEFIRQKGSHKVYRRADLIRPVIVPFHCGDLPTYVVRITLRQLNVSVDDYLEMLDRM